MQNIHPVTSRLLHTVAYMTSSTIVIGPLFRKRASSNLLFSSELISRNQSAIQSCLASDLEKNSWIDVLFFSDGRHEVATTCCMLWCNLCRKISPAPSVITWVFAYLQEEQMKGKPNWEHLNEELHVLVVVEDSQHRADIKMKRAVDEIKKLLVPAVSYDTHVHVCTSSGSWFLCWGLLSAWPNWSESPTGQNDSSTVCHHRLSTCSQCWNRTPHHPSRIMNLFIVYC